MSFWSTVAGVPEGVYSQAAKRGLVPTTAKQRMQFAEDKMSSLEKDMPQYTRPGEISQYLEMAKTNANMTQLPGQGQMEQNIQQSSQNAISNIQDLTESPTSSLGALADVNRMEIGAFNNLQMQSANYYQSNQDRLAQALKENANYSDQEWNLNTYAPWQRKMDWETNKYEAAQADRRQNKQNAWNMAGQIVGIAGNAIGGAKDTASSVATMGVA
jgi:hypothetical protein